MKEPGKLLAWLRRPHGLPLALFYVWTAGTIAGAVTFAAMKPESTALAAVGYALYGLAALSLGYAVYTAIYFFPRIRRSVSQWAEKYEFTAGLLHNFGFRTLVFALVSLSVSAAYAVFSGVVAVISLSVWYGALAAYYLLLTSLRGSVMLSRRKNRNLGEEERTARSLKSYRLCGLLLVLSSVAFTPAIVYVAVQGNAVRHAGLMIYASAAYAFYKIIMSVVNLVKARRQDDLAVQSLRNVNLADAMVSVLALQIAMFQNFSPETNVALPNALTGGAVCLLTLALGVYMLVDANRREKNARQGF